MKKNKSLLTSKIESIIKYYLKVFGLKQTESIAIFLGIITSIILIILLVLILIIFCSFIFSELLNDVFTSTYLGYLAISGVYVLTITFLIFRIKSTKQPAFTNLFIKLLIPLFKIETSQRNTLKGLKYETEKTQLEIETKKEDLELYLQLLQKSFIGDLKKEVKNMILSKVQNINKKKNPIKKKLKKEIMGWQTKIEALKNQLNEVAEESKEQLQMLISELETELADIKQKWDKMKKDENPRWDIFFNDLKSTFTKMKSKLENAKTLCETVSLST